MSDLVSNDELNALAAEYVLGTLDYEERKGAGALLEVDHAFRGVVRIWERRLGDLHLMVEPVEPDPKMWERIKSKVPAVPQITPVELLEAVDAAAAPPPAPAVSAGAGEAPPGDTTEAERKLAELAALLPAAAEQIAPSSSPAPESPTAPPSEPADQMATAVAEPANAVVVTPPPPMIRRPPPPVASAPAPVRRSGGRGWKATAMAACLCALALAGLIGAWRYFPEQLPAQLRADAVLNLAKTSSPPAEKSRPKPPPFDE